MRPLLNFVTCLLLTAMIACSSAPKRDPRFFPVNDSGISENTPFSVPASANKPSASGIAPGFVIALSTPEDRSLNGNFRVDWDGSLKLPYHVSLAVRGLTLDELKLRIAAAYKPYFKGHSPIGVQLVDRAYWVQLRGLISKPGKYLLKNGSTFDDAVSAGGGLLKDSEAHFARITSPDRVRVIDLDSYYKGNRDAAPDVWVGGEEIFFQREDSTGDLTQSPNGHFIRMLGEVRKPGELSFRNGADFYYYLTQAGGPTRDTDPEKIQIVRGVDGKRISTEFDFNDPTSIPTIHEGDILIVHADRSTAFQRALQTVGSIAAMVSAIAVMIIAL